MSASCASGNVRDTSLAVDNCRGCASGFKNDGTGRCVTLASACATGYTRDTTITTDNCRSCVAGYKNDGTGRCVLNSADCAIPNFRNDGTNLRCIGLNQRCATGFRDNGSRSCVASNSACAAGFEANAQGDCVLAVAGRRAPLVVQDSRGRPARCDPTCLSCEAGGKCNVCRPGYSLK